MPGYYRIPPPPHYEGTIIAEFQLGGRTGTTSISTQPTREGGGGHDFAPYDYFLMSHTVPENGWRARCPKGKVVSWRRE